MPTTRGGKIHRAAVLIGRRTSDGSSLGTVLASFFQVASVLLGGVRWNFRASQGLKRRFRCFVSQFFR